MRLTSTKSARQSHKRRLTAADARELRDTIRLQREHHEADIRSRLTLLKRMAAESANATGGTVVATDAGDYIEVAVRLYRSENGS